MPLGVRHRQLPRARDGDLGPDQGPMRDIEAQQSQSAEIAGDAEVGVQESVGEVASFVRQEIHEQEGRLVDHVDSPHWQRELETVERN